MSSKPFPIAFCLALFCSTSCVQKQNAVANAQKAGAPTAPSLATNPASAPTAGNKQVVKAANATAAIASGQKKTTAPQSATTSTAKTKSSSATKAAPSKAAPSTASSAQSSGASSSTAAKKPQAPAVKTKPAITEERTTKTKTVVDVVPVAAPDSELREP